MQLQRSVMSPISQLCVRRQRRGARHCRRADLTVAAVFAVAMGVVAYGISRAVVHAQQSAVAAAEVTHGISRAIVHAKQSAVLAAEAGAARTAATAVRAGHQRAGHQMP